MGTSFTNVFHNWFHKREVRILMIGLDAVGKTTILNTLQFGELVPTIPTIGFSVQTIKHNNFQMIIWDIGYNTCMPRLWPTYYRNSKGLIYVLDSNDATRIEDAGDLLHKFLENEILKDAFVLIFANKQDLPTAFKPNEIASMIKLSEITDQTCHIQGCSATTGEGLYEGLNWLLEQINQKFY